MASPTYNLIQEITVAGSVTSSISFTSIPQTFDDLILVGRGKNALDQSVWLRYNSDTGTNYKDINSAASGGTSGQGATTGNAQNFVTSGNEEQNYIFTINISGYKNTNWRKVSFTQNFTELGASNNVIAYRGNQWNNLSAITTITLLTSAGTNFVANSVFQLYGIKGS